jgi:hypothetical protein
MRSGALPLQTRKAVTLIFLAAGLAFWWRTGGPNSITIFQIAILVVAAVAALISPINSAVSRIAGQINTALATRRNSTAVVIAVLTAAYLLILAARNDDSLFLKINDEHAYMIQARMLAAGRLWMPAYPPQISPFFDALAMITDRVYAPMYFPGTALVTVPFIWLHLPYWLMPLIAASASAGMLYCVMCQIFDPLRGIIAVLLLESLSLFANNSTALMSEMPFLVAELAMLLAWFKFQSNPKWSWALLIGMAIGLAAITRPLDALCFCVPLLIALIVQLRQKPSLLAKSAAAALLGACPLLLLLLVQNIGVTGQWNQLAESYYNRENFPASPMGFHNVDVSYIPAGMSPPKQQWLREWVLPSFRNHTPLNALLSWPRGRLTNNILPAAVPNPLLRILIPLSLLSILGSRRIVVLAALALFLISNAFYLFLLDYYLISVLPAIICLILMGWDSLAGAFPGRNRVSTFLLISIACMSLTEMWKLAVRWQPDASLAPDQRPANRLLANLPVTPAVVLFRFDPRVESFHDDPVYNDRVIFPDDARVIRARDLGPQRNRAIIHYYAQRQPNRVFYIYDPDARAAGQNPLSPPLGTAADLDVRGTIP